MKQFRRFTALFLAVLLVTSLFPVHAFAVEQEPLTFETTYINPLYADIVSEEDIPPVVTPKVQTYETVKYATTVEEAGIVLREQMKARMEAPVVHIFANISTSEEFSALCNDIYEVAKAHTQEPNEGDYILWHLSAYDATGKLYAAEGGYNIDITYSMVYHSNAEQEAAVDAAVEGLLSQLNLSGRSDYEKVKAVYDYICKNVRYDKTSSGTLKHTAYAALINKTAVCQGYASLLYRLLLELGVDTRVIAGSTSNGDHGWNIVELDNLYYNADSTWDEGNTSYSWFLKSPDNFPDHNRFAEYTTEAFTSAYPIASADYVPHPHNYSTAVTAPTCTQQGYTTYTCDCGDSYVDNYVDATGHSFGSWYETKAPTEAEEGQEQRDCNNCDHFETRVIEKLPDSDPYSGTCGENLTWVFDVETGTLTISGTGDMYEYENSDSTLPWKAFSSQILTATLEEGVTSLSRNSLNLCEAMTQLNLPASLTSASIEALPVTGALTAINVDPKNPDYLSDSGVLYDVNLTALLKYPMSKADESYTLPNFVSKIAICAFSNCVNLKELFFTGNEAQISEAAFANTTLTAYYPSDNSSYTKIGMQNYGGTITWKPYCADEHVWNEGTVTQEPTCTQLGNATYVCTLCDVTKTEEIPATGHSWDAGVVTKEPTETETGIRTYTCTTCDEKKTEEIPVHVHEYILVVTDPTCTQQGYTTCTCSCGYSFVENYVDPIDHSWDNGEITKEPTETETGIRTYTCLVCGEHLFEELSTLEHTHDYKSTITAPTCTQQGYTTYTCSCGHTYQDNFVTANGHSFGSWYETKAPTEAEEGQERRDCNNCGNFETRVLEKLEPSDPYSGICGDDLTWNFDETSGQLTVSGSGAMYGADKLGWTNFKNNIRSVEIGSGATSVGAYAFADCENLTDVQMPNSVMRIAYNAFENCSSLTAVDIPDNVTEIAYGAFMDCSSLTAVDIPDNVTEISYSAFKDCTSLASLELPQNVMSISYHAFDNCTSLSEVDFPTSLASIGDDAFGSCTGLNEMHFTGNAPAIQSKAFSKVAADAYYPAANTTWTPDVLQNYGGTLTWIAEGGTVEPDNSCGENITWAFEESTGTLTISGKETMARSNGISVMDDYARPEDAPWYAYQDQIITIIIEGTVDSIGKNAFAGCSNLTTVIIEEGVSEIDDTAFSDCDALENCYFEGSEDQWDDLGADIGDAIIHTESAEPETHTETKKTVAPTCTEQGYDLYTCSCGTTRKDNFTEPTDHQWDDGVVTKEPTAAAPGIKTYTCTVCKTTRTEEIPYEAPVVSGSIQRISGKDRVKTALSVAKALKDTLKVDKFDAVIIATGVNEKFADALAGSYLANRKKAPILLYTNSGLSEETVAFIQTNLKENGTVYILGGDSAVPTTVEETLAAYNVVRLSGKTRYETNLEILKEAGISGNEILVATGNNFADSLSASAVGLPLLLVNGKNTSLNAAQTEFLNSVAGKKITILGGDSAVSEEMKAAIEAVTGVTAERISGKTRHNTSVLIAQKYFPDADAALITYAKNFPDGLAGGPLAYALGAPLLLTNAGQEAIANEHIAAESIESGYVLGGDSAVSDETARKVFGLAADAAIEKAYYTE